MDKNWNVTFYDEGRPVGGPQNLVTDDAVALIYRLSLPSVPSAAVTGRVAPETGELTLIAA